jgi:transcription antitermination factor NusG
MKTLLTISGIFLFGLISFAQPSDAQLIAKIKADNPSATKVELFGQGIITKVIDDQNSDGYAEYYSYYRHTYRTHKPTDYTGITEVYSGSIQYINNGSAFVFDQYLIGDRWFLGVPDPDQGEILKMLKSDIENFVENAHYISIVGDISEITFPADPEYLWHELTSVSFLLNVTYAEKISYTQVRKAKHTYNVRMYSDAFKGPWKSSLSTREEEDSNEGEITTYTADELRAIPSLSQIDAENKAKLELSSLPNVGNVPVFDSGEKLFYFIHDIILTKSTQEVKAYLYKVLSVNCFIENSTVIVNDYNQQWINKILDNHEAYIACYCPYPAIKHQQSNMLQFYDKVNTKMLRMQGVEEGGTWKIITIDFYPSSKSEQDQMRNMTENCEKQPELKSESKPQYKVGDNVTGVFSNGEFDGVIDQIDAASNKYYIKLSGDNSGTGYWMDAQFVKPGHTGKLINGGSSSSTSSGSNFKVNETVYVLTSSGEKVKAKIKEISGDKANVHFSNPMYQDMWVSLSNCSREK